MELEHRDEVDPARLARWDGICHETVLAMQDHCMRYVTPISHAVEHEWGTLEGTGSYIEFAGKRLLISNEHVLRDWKTRQFAHQFHGCDDVFKLGEPLALEKHPVDASACVIGDDVWSFRTHSAEAVPLARIAERHAPVSGELLFVTGYPEARSKSLYRNLMSRATRLVTQELMTPPPPDLHPNYFMLSYAPEKAQCVDPSQAVTLSNPHGMSGSLVWNTRRVECLAENRQWAPELAQVTGLLCRWDSPTVSVLTVRVEVLREFLGRLGLSPSL